MTLHIGQNIPSVPLKQLGETGMTDISSLDLFAGKKVCLFAVPGAFTPTCSAKHLPGFVSALAAFKAQGIEVLCMSVNDAFVMKAWASAHNADGITMVADGNALLTKAMGLELDATAHGMGLRCKRFALYADNGVVKALCVEEPGKFEVSSAEAMLKTITSCSASCAA